MILEKHMLYVIINVMNEVCHGIKIHQFQEKFDCSKQFASNLLNKLIKFDNFKKSIDINSQELDLIKKSLDKVCCEIEEWEFETRIGVSFSEVEKIKNFLLE